MQLSLEFPEILSKSVCDMEFQNNVLSDTYQHALFICSSVTFLFHAGETILDTGDHSLTEDKDNEDVNAIVKSVVNTIRDLSAKLQKTQSKPCPICGDIVSGQCTVYTYTGIDCAHRQQT